VAVPTAQLAHELEKGEVDLAIGYFPALSLKTVRQRRVSTQHWSIVMRADHPLRSQPMTLAAFSAAEHLVVRAEGRSQEVLERFLERRRIKRNVALLSPNFLSVPFLVSRSNLIATIPHSVALHFGCMSQSLVGVPPPFDAPTFDLKFHWHRRFDNEARSRWLRDQLTEVFREDPTLPQPNPPVIPRRRAAGR
jgi:DNA-binding transcriptional LysR family regulator